MRKTPLLLLLASTAFLLTGCGDKGSAAWQEIQDDVRVQLIREDQMAPNLVSRKLTDEVSIGYVIHRDEKYVFVKNADLKEWEIKFTTLEEVAAKNLKEATPENVIDFTEKGNGAYGIIETGDGYDAARVMLPSVRKELKRQFGSSVIIGIPSRDFLVAWPDGFDLYSEFAKEVSLTYQNDTEYGLSPALLKLENGELFVEAS